MRLIDIDELLTDITSEIKDCKDILGIIERQTLIDTSKELVICPVKVNMDTDEVLERLKERGWEPVIHGQWEAVKLLDDEADFGEIDGVECSVCGGTYHSEYWAKTYFKFCPYCGAKMDGAEE